MEDIAKGRGEVPSDWKACQAASLTRRVTKSGGFANTSSCHEDYVSGWHCRGGVSGSGDRKILTANLTCPRPQSMISSDDSEPISEPLELLRFSGHMGPQRQSRDRFSLFAEEGDDRCIDAESLLGFA